MSPKEVGIGELLRHLSDLFDRDAERIYASMKLGVDYRARYTPVIRAFGDGPMSIGELQKIVRVTQGAISQTVKLMKEAGLLEAADSTDQRVSRVDLTKLGRSVKATLTAEWEMHIDVINDLEREIDVPLREALAEMISALERKSYFERIEEKTKTEGCGIR
ncbi:MarR family winged helix-turn-helix transcriptional regulator [Roseibium sp. SCP14]|uniref:MarR family winged helix-turn-helix transcriptional regulator n=1 Tax=Roseibium sp. SCP14 TaxID=3141375 RepID=UPI003338356D